MPSWYLIHFLIVLIFKIYIQLLYYKTQYLLKYFFFTKSNIFKSSFIYSTMASNIVKIYIILLSVFGEMKLNLVITTQLKKVQFFVNFMVSQFQLLLNWLINNQVISLVSNLVIILFYSSLHTAETHFACSLIYLQNLIQLWKKCMPVSKKLYWLNIF